jgi:hypothetical protein
MYRWLHFKFHYNSMDKRKVYPIMTLGMAPSRWWMPPIEDGSSLSFDSGGAVASSRRPPSSWWPPLGLAMIYLECPPPKGLLSSLAALTGLDNVFGEWRLSHAIRVASTQHWVKGDPNRHKSGLGRSERADRPRPFLCRFGSILLPAAHLDIFHLAPFICVILRSSSSQLSWGIFMHELPMFSSRSSGVLHSSTLVLATFGGNFAHGRAPWLSCKTFYELVASSLI